MKKHSIVENFIPMKCWKCDGTGLVDCFKNSKDTKTVCDVCHGTGEWIEKHYIVVDEVNKIAVDSDTGG